MIRVFVGTRHLYAFLGCGSVGNLVPAVNPLPAAPYPDIKSESDLAKKTVFDALKWFHESVFCEQGLEAFRDDAA